jgi:hypothetical protein
MRWHLVAADRLDPQVRLSPRYVWTAAKEMFQPERFPSTFLSEDGTSLKAGLDVVRKFGAALEDELPWETGLASRPPAEFNDLVAERTIVGYVTLKDPDGWRRWLYESGPVLVLLKKDRHLDSGVLQEFDEASAGDEGHAAALFGYGPGYFLVRSSWGTDWADAGYARMSLEYAAKAVAESYGVIV